MTQASTDGCADEPITGGKIWENEDFYRPQ